jgi:hypothetical protein
VLISFVKLGGNMATIAGETVWIDGKGKYQRKAEKAGETYTVLMKKGQPVRRSLIAKLGLEVKGHTVFAPGGKKKKAEDESAPAAPAADAGGEAAPY